MLAVLDILWSLYIHLIYLHRQRQKEGSFLMNQQVNSLAADSAASLAITL